MLGYVTALCLVLLALGGLVLQKTYYYLPYKELKRWAGGGDKLAPVLYRAVAFGVSLRVLLWAWIGLTAAGGFVLLARIAPPIYGFIAIALLLWLAFAWLPSTRLTSIGARLAVWLTPAVVWILNYTSPLLERLYNLVHAQGQISLHTRLYQREDLLDLLEKQQHQGDNRIPLEELEIARRALSFSDHKLRDIVVPRKKVRTVSPDDAVGPVLAGELHEAGHQRFPVYDKKAKAVVGVLFIDKISQLSNVKKGGHVRDYMEEGVIYLHENDSLLDALDAFYKTKQQLFVVVNSFEEYVGIATLDDILLQLLGAQVTGDFVQFDDPKAVAARHLTAPKTETPEPSAEETETENLPPSEETVVE